MQFELSSALIDDILFSMEDQHDDCALDTQEGTVVNTGDNGDEADGAGPDRYITLPEWGPADGFRLMERFTAGLRNALVREELSAALNRGRGVFRAFKNTLSRYPETEKLWFGYKDRAMKRVVVAWYNGLRESWGMELIGEEPEDTAALVLEDFRFRLGTEEDAGNAAELHRACLDESGPQGLSGGILAGMGEWAFPGDLSFVAETTGGEFAGYISAVCSGDSARICAVEVQAEYRGLGLGKTLLARLLEQADSEKMTNITIDLPAGQEHFSRALLREYFTPCVQRYRRAVQADKCYISY